MREIGVEARRTVDIWHLLEYLYPAAFVLETNGKVLAGQFRRWKDDLLEKPNAADAILKQLRDNKLTKVQYKQKQPVKDAIRYMEKRLKMMRYAQSRRYGLPVGSGNVEATCKSLVAIRMKRAGARWKMASGEDVIQLRALMLSDRFNMALGTLLRPLRKPVKPIRKARLVLKAA